MSMPKSLSRKVTFASSREETVWTDSLHVRNFSTTPNGVRWEAVIFSSEFNRNNAYFDIHKMMRWSNKLERVVMNNDHDSKQKFSSATDKIVELRVETEEATGITEAFAVIESTHPDKIANPDQVTGFSIELRVTEEDVLEDKDGKGEYYKNYDWTGMAYLRGKMAGSGDTRILERKTFAQINKNIMDETQVKALLDEQAKQFEAQLTEVTEKLKTFEVTNKEETMTTGSYTYVSDDGTTYTTDWKSLYSAITNKDKPAEGVSEASFEAAKVILTKMFSTEGVNATGADDNSESTEDLEGNNESTDESKEGEVGDTENNEAEEAIKQIENAINASAKIKNFGSAELEGPGTGTLQVAVTNVQFEIDAIIDENLS